jgi:hypothetical protein
MPFELDSRRGVFQSYGVRTTNGKYGSQQGTKNGVIKSAIWDFVFNDLPSAGTSAIHAVIPAGATIISTRLLVDVAFASTSGTTTLTVGLQQANGTEIDNDGLIQAAQATDTAIETVGNVITGAGALIGKTIGANNGELVVTPSVADLTAGKGRIVVEYVYDKN